MIETTSLLPPGSGLRANPVLFGVSEALARLLPPPDDPAFAATFPGYGPADAAATDRDKGGDLSAGTGQGV